MTTTNKFVTGSVLAAAAILGCGGVSGIPIEKTATDFSKAICSSAYKCCTPDTLMGNDAAGMSEAECETKTATNFRSQLQTMQDSENKGRSKFDQKKVDACLDALRAASCGTLTSIRSLSGIPECNSTFVTPLVAVGATCGQDFECIDSVCQKEPMAWEGVCAAGNSTGAACADNNRCAPKLICDGRGTSDDASDDVCVAEQDNGATCVDGFDCKSRNCIADGTTGAKTCQAPTAPQCFYGGGCAAGGGRPSLAALLLMGLFVVVALVRTRRRAR
jgi:hypothetical protein